MVFIIKVREEDVYIGLSINRYIDKYKIEKNLILWYNKRIYIINNESNKENISSFFGQLGKKVIEIIDLFIDKMKDKRQSYK